MLTSFSDLHRRTQDGYVHLRRHRLPGYARRRLHNLQETQSKRPQEVLVVPFSKSSCIAPLFLQSLLVFVDVSRLAVLLGSKRPFCSLGAGFLHT